MKYKKGIPLNDSAILVYIREKNKYSKSKVVVQELCHQISNLKNQRKDFVLDLEEYNLLEKKIQSNYFTKVIVIKTETKYPKIKIEIAKYQKQIDKLVINSNELAKINKTIQEKKNQVISANLGLVISIAKKYSESKEELQDMIQWGNIGLIKAVSDYDPTQAAFSSYATPCIETAIRNKMNDIRETIRIPNNLKADYKKIIKTLNEIEPAENPRQTIETLQKLTELSEKRIKSALNNSKFNMCSFDIPLFEDGTSIQEVIEDDQINLEKKVLQTDVKTLIKKVLFKSDCLEESEKKVIGLRYGFVEVEEHLTKKEAKLFNKMYNLHNQNNNGHQNSALDDLTLEETGKILGGCTRENIRRIESEALRKLEVRFRIEKLKDF